MSATQISRGIFGTARQFAKVIVRNVPATIDPIPDQTVLEGQEVTYSATFHTPEWPDKHTARFDFGDDSLPVQATVVETNQPPQAAGTGTAKHAYCKAGDYTVTVTVQDDDGGIGTQTFTVHAKNVQPKVVASDLFEYACTPITLRACFYDPGWCKTHTATWDFGDCTPISPAVIVETHKPPMGTGSASAAHCYHDCGEFSATCVVTDSEGGVGTASIVVRVVDVRNKHFENGFRQLTVGQVANAWEPYPAHPAQQVNTGAAASGALTFAADETIFRRGEHSQRIEIPANSVAGIYQQVGANQGWDYQVTAWFALDQRRGGSCRLGLDPAGGTDPTAASIFWSQSREDTEWTELLVVATATAAKVTVFLEASTKFSAGQPPFQPPDQAEIRADSNGTVANFDDVALLPYLWKLKDCFPPVRKPSQQCVDWKAAKPHEVPSPYQDSGFTFISRTGQTLLIVTFGPPPGEGKLVIPSRGLEVTLPQPSMQVTATVFTAGQTPVELTAYAADGGTAGTAKSQPGITTPQQLTINGHGMVKLLFGTGVMEGTLIQLCATPDVDTSKGTGTLPMGSIAGSLRSN
jgi:PKD repeat protein